ncbi:hypothetical protein [Rheinheimera sp.]|uniref:hypothetical protein n=1 Tax=Rheinheimera sp. TaxID=1869214 RepID=UPI0037C7330A
MRSVLCYLLLLTLALSGLAGSVQQAHAYNLADAIVMQSMQHQHDISAENSDIPCHGSAAKIADDSSDNCCKQMQHQCGADDCCAKHCATSGALLAAELFRYIRPDNVISRHTADLPLWLFAEESPPPINA